LALSKHSEWEAAVQELRTAVRLGPEKQEVHYALAQALRKAGRSDEAAAEFRLVQHMQEGSNQNARAAFLEYQTKKMIESGEVDRAIDNYRVLLQLRKDARTATNLASALLWKGDADGAIDVLQRALQIDPSYAWAHYYLGVSFARKREYQRAGEALKEALKLRPDFPEAEFYWGLSFAGQGRFQDAEAHLRSAVGMRPDAAPARHYLGLVLEQLGKNKEGEAELQASRRLDPTYKPDQPTTLHGMQGTNSQLQR
jgi:tetratricopeptide (TPR) repeat protein